ncbi:MAG: extracellular solute-binding protein [Candidatus Riflebacteria bacterium]|nr:extracellular solute-binding protein [Candidatus Riflebacteria bacterium]
MLQLCIKSIFLSFLVLSSSLACAAEELVFWNFWDPKFILPVIEQFEKDNPGVKIRNEQISWNNGLDKVVVAMANGRAPDICELGSTWTGRFMAEGALIDVTGQFADLKPRYLMWGPVTMGDRLYGMPWLVSTRVMFFNRDLYKKAGLDPDKPPKTWAELLDAASRIHNPGEGVYGFGMNAGEGHILYKKFMPFAWGNGGQIIDAADRFVFDSSATREALDFYLKLKEFSYCEKQDLLDEAFKRGKLGLAVSGSWNFARYPVEAPQLDFGVALMPEPAADKGFSTSFMGGQVLVLFKTCKNPEIAARFIRFLTRAENTLPITREAFVSFPAHLEAYKDELFTADPRMAVFVEQLKTAIHPPVHRLWIDLEKIINSTVEKAMYGQVIDEVFAEAKIEFKRVVARNEDSTARAQSHDSSSLPVSDSRESPWGRGGITIFLLALIGTGIIVNALLLAYVLRAGKGSRQNNLPDADGPIRRSQRVLLFMSPWLLTFGVFWLYPLLFSLILSFCAYDVFHPAVFSFAGLKNYLRLLEDADFVQSFSNTLFFVIGTTPVITALALALALMINSVRQGSQVFRSVFFLPSIISIVVTATIFKSIYSPVGILNRMLGLAGLPGHAWLVEKGLALPAIMLMNIWAYTGFYMVLYLAALKAVPRQLYEAAEVDGADEWQQLRFITLPQIRNMTIFILIMNTIRSWQVFPEVFTLTRGGPVGSTNTIVHHLYETAFRYHEMGYSSAISYVLLVIILAFSFFQMHILQGKNR